MSHHGRHGHHGRSLDDLDNEKEFQRFLTWLRTAGHADDAYWLNKLKQYPEFLEHRGDREGHPPLIFAILNELLPEKISIMLLVKPDMAHARWKHQSPLALALQYHANIEVLTRLIDACPEALSWPDGEGFLPLNSILRAEPFSASFVDLAIRMAHMHPEAAWHSVSGRLPLHTCLVRKHPNHLILAVFSANNCAAAVPTKEGLFPLHIAVSNGMDDDVVFSLLNAYPAALLERMSGRQLVLEHALRNNLSHEVKFILMTGGMVECTMDPRVFAYTRAAADGQATVFPKHLADSSTEAGWDFFNNEKSKAPIMFKAWEGDRMNFSVKPFNDDAFTLTMKSTNTVADVKREIEILRGTPIAVQRLEFGNRQMMDSEMLSENKVVPHSVVRMLHQYELLHLALTHRQGSDDDRIILMLLQMRPQSAAEDDHSGRYPLQMALQARAGTEVIRELLLQHPSGIRAALRGGLIGAFPLHLALQERYECDVIKMLLSDITERDWQSTGAYCPYMRDWQSTGAVGPCYVGDTKEKDRVQPPLHIAVEVGCKYETVKLLLKSKCPVFSRSNGLLPLECLLGRGQELSIEVFHLLLLRMGAEAAELPHKFYDQPVQQAFHRIIVACTTPTHSRVPRLHPLTQQTPTESRLSLSQDDIESMLRIGIERALEAKSNNGRVPLHYAVPVNLPQMVVGELCALAPKTLAIRDIDGQLPLHVAVAHGASCSVVRCLLAADPSAMYAPNARGQAPVFIALLSKKGARPGVITELTRLDPSTLRALDSRGRSVVEVAAAADIPEAVAEELSLLLPSEMPAINLFAGSLCQTRAAATLLRESDDFALGACRSPRMLSRSPPRSPPRSSIRSTERNGARSPRTSRSPTSPRSVSPHDFPDDVDDYQRPSATSIEIPSWGLWGSGAQSNLCRRASVIKSTAKSVTIEEQPMETSCFESSFSFS